MSGSDVVPASGLSVVHGPGLYWVTLASAKTGQPPSFWGSCLCLLGDAELTDGLRFLILLLLHDLERGLPLVGDARGMQLLDLCLLLLFNLESDLLLLGEAAFGLKTRFPGAPLLLPVCNICRRLVNESKNDGNMLSWGSELAGDVLGLCKPPLLGLELARALLLGVSEPAGLDLTLVLLALPERWCLAVLLDGYLRLSDLGSRLGSNLFAILEAPLGLGPRGLWQGVGNKQSACGGAARVVGDDGAAVGATNAN
ncbi:MAG: hypothetical protein FRX49_05309 [Trebouxia sp. A1-2]|nr:MAG: hypothetical protein FRX49_05309 [Trebouxia sp. A1-2]